MKDVQFPVVFLLFFLRTSRIRMASYLASTGFYKGSVKKSQTTVIACSVLVEVKIKHLRSSLIQNVCWFLLFNV